MLFSRLLFYVWLIGAPRRGRETDPKCCAKSHVIASPLAPAVCGTVTTTPPPKPHTATMATVCTFINAAAASTSAARSSPCSRRASVSSVRATAKSASSSTSAPARTVLGGVTLPRDVHRRRGAVVMRAEGEGIQRDDPKLDEKFATIGYVCTRCIACYHCRPERRCAGGFPFSRYPNMFYVFPTALENADPLPTATPRVLPPAQPQSHLPVQRSSVAHTRS